MAAKYTIGPLFPQNYPITQKYGENPDYYKQFNLPGHEGADFGTPNGTSIISPFNGIILRDTFGDKDYGNFTVVWDPIQLIALWYCHLQDIATNPGDKVVKGQVLGHTNNTGNSSGPHCHVNFVETDSLGNRLNKSNSYQGFMNILDPSLVAIEPLAPVVVTPPILVDNSPDYFKTLLQENKLDLSNESQIRLFFQQAIDYPNLVNNLNDATQRLSVCQSDLITAKQVIGQLQTKLTVLQVDTPSNPFNTGAVRNTGFFGWLRSLFG